MAEWQGSLARLGLPHRYAGLLHERFQFFSCFTVEGSSSRDNKWFFSLFRISTASEYNFLSARIRGIRHTLFSKRDVGKSNASVCTSWGRQIVTAPVSSGDVSTLNASSIDHASCSGLLIRSQYLETGLKASLTVTSCPNGYSSSCRTGPTFLFANVSLGRSNRGIRLMVAVAAPVIILVEPGPTDAVQASACIRYFALANAMAVWVIACSFRAR